MAGELSHAEATFGLPAGTFPFASRFLDLAEARLHYVDEGAGPAVVLLHGNPTWSFLYRHPIAGLRADFRCIAIDLAGFGLSEAAPGFSYRPVDQGRLVARALESLEVQGATLLAHDWGGPIGLDAWWRTEGRIGALCLGNTWAWPVGGEAFFEAFAKTMGGPPGRFANERFCAFVNWAMPLAMRRRKLTEVEMRAYRGPFADRGRRGPLSVLPREITAAGAWLGELEAAVQQFDGPVRFVWPDGDIAFGRKELARWQRLLPRAGVTRIPRCGHYLWEDAPADALAAVRAFLTR